MEIHQLRYFVAVAEEGSILQCGGARARLATFSQSEIHKLEEELPPPHCYDAPGRSEVRGQTSEIRSSEVRFGETPKVRAGLALHARRARDPVVGAFPEVNRGDSGLRFKMSP